MNQNMSQIYVFRLRYYSEKLDLLRFYVENLSKKLLVGVPGLGIIPIICAIAHKFSEKVDFE